MSGGGSKSIPETEEERELARVSGDKWNDYIERFVPFENEYIQKIEVTDADHENFKGDVVGQTNQVFGEAREKELQGEQQLGVKPGSGRFNGALERVMKKQGQSLGYRTTDADNSMNQRRVEGLQSAINIGRGKEATALTGMAELANQSASDASADAEADQIRSQGNHGAVGIGLGAAGRSYQGNSDSDGGD